MSVKLKDSAGNDRVRHIDVGYLTITRAAADLMLGQFDEPGFEPSKLAIPDNLHDWNGFW
jgi:hypothetical protein